MVLWLNWDNAEHPDTCKASLPITTGCSKMLMCNRSIQFIPRFDAYFALPPSILIFSDSRGEILKDY